MKKKKEKTYTFTEESIRDEVRKKVERSFPHEVKVVIKDDPKVNILAKKLIRLRNKAIKKAVNDSLRPEK